MKKIYKDKGTVIKPSVAKGFLPPTTTGTDKGMTLPNARRSYRLIKRTEERKKLFEEGARAANIRHKIDAEGRVKVAKPFVERVKDNPERHIHPRHKRAA